MAEFILFCLPTVVYILVQRGWRHRPVGETLADAGLSRGAGSSYGLALLLLPPLILTGWLAVALIPTEVLDQPGVTIARLTSFAAALGIILRALGEEVFFRGLLGGALVRRLGFTGGNLVQATLFLLPHLSLLLVDVGMWPILPVQWAAGWMLGWLRHRTGTLLPGAVVHAAANIGAGLLIL